MNTVALSSVRMRAGRPTRGVGCPSSGLTDRGLFRFVDETRHSGTATAAAFCVDCVEVEVGVQRTRAEARDSGTAGGV